MVSALLLESWLETADPQFLPSLRECRDDRLLAKVADRMVLDQRPWVRDTVLAYLDQPLDRPGHHPLVKRLFKHFERVGDREVMARFLVAFDRAVRRRVVNRTRWDPASRSVVPTVEVVLPKAALLPAHPARHAKAKRIRPQRRVPEGAPLFSLATRLYLRRRAWRFFRRLGYRDPGGYVAAVASALARYSDGDLSGGHDLLESWGLASALFRHSRALRFTGTWITVADGCSLADLQPAPRFARLWKDAAAAPHLIGLACDAGSRLVRTWSQDLLRAEHPTALVALPMVALRRFFDSAHEDVRVLGLELFRNHPAVADLALADWWTLLAASDAMVVEGLADAMRRHVPAARLTHADAVRLSCHRSVPACRLGLSYLAAMDWRGDAARAALTGLARATCAALAEELGAFLLAQLGTLERYRCDEALVCFDHRLAGMRLAGMRWLDSAEHGRRDPLLWARLSETPYPDLHEWLIRALDRHHAEASISGDQRRLLWATVLLGVHRGGRSKIAALRQLSDQLAATPAEYPAPLLAVLGVALRSLSAPERRAALAALVALLVRRPDLRPAIVAAYPEVDCSAIAMETV